MRILHWQRVLLKRKGEEELALLVLDFLDMGDKKLEINFLALRRMYRVDILFFSIYLVSLVELDVTGELRKLWEKIQIAKIRRKKIQI